MPQGSSHVLFVVDTGSYAGNFERELCAYVTGEVGDCGVGYDAAAVFKKEVQHSPLDNLVIQLPTGDHGVYRPCELYPNPRWFNNGQGGHFRVDDPTAEEKALAHYKKTAIEYLQGLIKRVESNRNLPAAKRESLGWTDEAIERAVARHREEIAAVTAKTTTTKFPAYNSVSIFLAARPSDEQVSFMKERAQRFPQFYLDSATWNTKLIHIEGFRLVNVVTTESAEEV